jgi:hypothetical protein
MKAKPILILIALIILVMVISFFLTQQSLKNPPLPQNISREEGVQILSERAPQIARLPLKPAKRAITPIKKKALSQEIEAISGAKARTQDTRETQKSAYSAQATAAASATSETELAADAGITKISKRPTPDKINELNSQGIIIY